MYPPSEPPIDPLGLPPAPAAPTVPVAPTPKQMNPIIQSLLTAAAAMAGPGRGTGILQGLNLSQQQATQAAEQQHLRNQQDYARQVQAYQTEEQAWQRQQTQRAAMLQKVLADFQSELQNTGTETEADNLYQSAAQVLQAQGFRGFDVDNLKRRYKSPDMVTRANQAITKFLSNPVNKQAFENDPEAVGKATVVVAGVPMTVAEAQALTGGVAPTAKPKVATPRQPAVLGSFEDYVTRKYGETPTPEQILEGRKTFNQVDDRAPRPVGVGAPTPTPPPGGSDAEAIADAIISGKQPPTLQGLYRNTAAVRATLARKGYNLTDATSDWSATQSYLKTLNGAQQVRLRQAVAFTKDSLPLVEQLANEWNAGVFKPLNRANLAAAKSGAYGQKAQSVAERLDGQIADLVSELATVYKGGNSSTDDSLKLAAKNLSSDWSQQTMLDAIQQIRKNLQIRENSIRSGAPIGSGDNAYAPAPATDPVGESALGKLNKRGKR